MEHCVLMKAVTYCQNRIFIGTISILLRSHVDIESDGGSVCANEFQERCCAFGLADVRTSSSNDTCVPTVG